MKLIVAVSGGIDSVVLLDMLSRIPGNELVVAHFDHGIRPDSPADVAFVARLAASYQLPFETQREELGEDASEERARARRYGFLREVAKKHGGVVATAHHADDIIDTVVINFLRGTGWRGLAVLDSDVYRPLLAASKREITAYAAKHNLHWREDSTNSSDAYLRNRVRSQTETLDESTRKKLLKLWATQRELKHKIDTELSKLIEVQEGPFSRYWYTMLPVDVAIECLRRSTAGVLTRPQLQRLLLAIKTIRPGKIYQAGANVQVHFTSRHFVVTVLK